MITNYVKKIKNILNMVRVNILSFVALLALSCTSDPLQELTFDDGATCDEFGQSLAEAVPGSFTYQILDGTDVRQLDWVDDRLFATTNQGLYIVNLQNQLEVTDCHFTGGNVTAYSVLDDGSWLISALVDDEENVESGIFRSSDQGEQWVRISDGLNSEQEMLPEYITSIEESGSDVVAIAGNTIAKSENRGNTWSTTVGEWGTMGHAQFLKAAPSAPEQLWAGSVTTNDSGWLVHSDDGGNSWKQIEPWEQFGNSGQMLGYMIQPEDLSIHRSNPSRVLLVIGSVLRTVDAGETWERLGTDTAKTAITTSPTDAETVYSAGNTEDGRIVLSVSTNYGDSWEGYTSDHLISDIEVHRLLALEVDGREIIFIATNNGIYSFSPA